MKCSNCGQESPEGTKFCTSCGTKFEESNTVKLNVSNEEKKVTEIKEVTNVETTQENNNQDKEKEVANSNVVTNTQNSTNTTTTATNVPKPNIVLGILSIVLSPFVAIAGLILGIVSIVKGKKIKKISKDAKVTSMYVLGGIGIGLSVISMIVGLILSIILIGTIFATTKIEDEFENFEINNKIEKEVDEKSNNKGEYSISGLELEFDKSDWKLSGATLVSNDSKSKINLPTVVAEESKITSDISTSSKSSQAYDETIKVISSDSLTLGKGSNKYIKINSKTYYMSVNYEQTMSDGEEVYGKIYVVGYKENAKTVFCLFKTFFFEEDYKYEDDVEDEVLDIIKNMEFIKDETEDDSKSQVEENTSITETKDSSEDSPIAFGEWGNASRYSQTEYVDVPVQLTNITRGEEAAKILKEYCENNKKIYKYTEPKINMEWAVIEYKADLTNVYEYSMGRSVRVDSKIQSIGGGSLKYNDVTYFLTTADISESYSKETIANGKFAVQLPVGCTDYMIVMGSSVSTATKAYFKGK